MPSIKDLKKRIGTVKNTQQTTKAMKMVSAAKLRRAQDAIQAQRPYAKRLGDLIRLLYSISDSPVDSPFMRRSDGAADAGGKKALLVLVTSDRGLCGAFNANVIKSAQRWIVANSANYESVTLSFVGRKGYDFFKTKQGFTLGTHYVELGGKVSFAKAKKLSDTVVEQFLSGQYDEVKFIYNEFKNAVSQQVKTDNFLPLETQGAGAGDTAEIPLYIVEPDYQTVLKQLVEKNFAIQVFRMMLESQAGEHGARMSAMENATKNAQEMIRKLTLQYNKQRQAGITKELLEIISGSESQKSSS